MHLQSTLGVEGRCCRVAAALQTRSRAVGWCCSRRAQFYYSATLIQFYCPEDQYDESATLFITPSEDAILQLFHMPGDHAWSPGRLFIFFIIYAFYTCWTYGA